MGKCFTCKYYDGGCNVWDCPYEDWEYYPPDEDEYLDYGDDDEEEGEDDE